MQSAVVLFTDFSTPPLFQGEGTNQCVLFDNEEAGFNN